MSDNGSTDDTSAVVDSHRAGLPTVRIIDSSARPGVAYARNAGIEAAGGRSVVLCDDDDEVDPTWLEAMARALWTHDFVAASMAVDTINEAWTRNPSERRHLRFTDPPFLPFAFGATLGIRRDVHLAVGGFDESFVGGADDVDYCWRVQLYGAALHPAPDAVVHYRIREDLPAIYRQARAYGRGDVRLYTKYRALGMGRPSQLKAARFWLLCWPRLVPALIDRRRLPVWVWRFGRRVGYLRGSLAHRTMAL